MLRALFVCLLLVSAPNVATAKKLQYSNYTGGKTVKADDSAPKACIYLTTSAPHGSQVSRTAMQIRIQLQNLSTNPRYKIAEFPVAHDVDFLSTYKSMNGEYGDVYEGCVVPGKYAIARVTHSYGIGGAMIVFPPHFAPIGFELEAGKDYYLGNFVAFAGVPIVVEIRKRLDLDLPLIQNHAKRKPVLPLVQVNLQAGDNLWIRNQ